MANNRENMLRIESYRHQRKGIQDENNPQPYNVQESNVVTPTP